MSAAIRRALAAVERFNREIKRQSMVRTEVIPREGGDFSVVLGLDDEKSNLMTLELMAPTQTQGRGDDSYEAVPLEQLLPYGFNAAKYMSAK